MKTDTNRRRKKELTRAAVWPWLLTICMLWATETTAAQDRKGLTPQQMQANEQVMANKLYETAFKAEPIQGNPFDDYEDVIVHNDGSFTLLAPANRTTRNPDGSRTLLSGANRVVRYSPDGEIEWERSLSGNKQTQLDEASKGGEIITLLEADGVRWKLSAIYNQNGNKITLDTDRVVNKEIKVSPSGNYLYATSSGYAIQRFELFSSTGMNIDFPFEQLLSIDRTSYNYTLGFHILENDMAIVSLYEMEDGDKDNLVRATLDVISLEKENVLFNYDRKIQNPARTARKTIGVPFNTIQIRGDYIYFLTLGPVGGFYGYHLPNQKEVLKMDGSGWYYVSEDNQYLLHRSKSNIYSLINIATEETINQYHYLQKVSFISFKVNQNQQIILLLGGLSHDFDTLVLFDTDGNLQSELYGWFASPETGYIRDIQNTYKFTKTEREEQ